MASGGDATRGHRGELLILAGDVGGTKTNLGLFRWVDGRPRLLRGAHFISADFPSLEPLLAQFLAGDHASIAAACFGVPGPVVENYARTPNLAWEIDGVALGRAMAIPALTLVNDLVATAAGVALLDPADVAVLQPGDPGASAGGGNRALIAAGTGLGMALLPARPGGGHAAVASEGGHMDYAPRTEDELALYRTLRDRFGHVSVERVLSGPGLHNIYLHLSLQRSAAGGSGGRPSELERPDTAEMLARLAAEDPAKVIAEAALAGASPLAARALDLFAAAYGAAAGNLALLGTATGGVYLGGGIAPKILDKLRDGTFLCAFQDKGRFRSYLEAVPVRVVLNERAALFGAARLAADLLS
jgi:glucokinase